MYKVAWNKKGSDEKENFKSYVNRKELVSDFLFDTKSGYSVGSTEGEFEEFLWATIYLFSYLRKLTIREFCSFSSLAQSSL